MFLVPEKYRIRTGTHATDFRCGNNGAFILPPKIGNRHLYIIASDGMGWEHVSVHAYEGKKTLIPTWIEMCHVKDLFWDDNDVVMQLHPKKTEYVNNHPSVLHLWRPTDNEIPTPPSILVGFKDVKRIEGDLNMPTIDEMIKSEKFAFEGAKTNLSKTASKEDISLPIVKTVISYGLLMIQADSKLQALEAAKEYHDACMLVLANEPTVPSEAERKSARLKEYYDACMLVLANEPTAPSRELWDHSPEELQMLASANASDAPSEADGKLNRIEEVVRDVLKNHPRSTCSRLDGFNEIIRIINDGR